MCMYCTGEVALTKTKDDTKDARIYIDDDNYTLDIWLYQHGNGCVDELLVELPINFCPICGRNLKEDNDEIS